MNDFNTAVETPMAASASETHVSSSCQDEDEEPPGPPSLSDCSVDCLSSIPLSPFRTFHYPPIRARRASFSSLSSRRKNRDSWQWQLRNRIRNLADLQRHFPEVTILPGMTEAAMQFPMAITPYYASLIRKWDRSDPVFSMAVPQPDELLAPPFLQNDPLEEDHDMAVPGLVHRYPDRALLLATSVCAMYCRHCTRKRVAGQREWSLSLPRLAKIIDYLRANPQIHDVIVSGGDPLTLSTERLETILDALRSVESVDIIRIGSRTPVTMPMRITDDLVAMLRRHHPVWINTHFNHPQELTPEAVAALNRLADAGIPLGNQTVLLRGINDDLQLLEQLFRSLVKNRVRPYYLFQCDLVRGVEHFRTPISRGIEIMEYLRGRLSGLAIPAYVVDAPGGGGKLPLLPSYVVSISPTHTVLRNFEGMLVSYPEPCDMVPDAYRRHPLSPTDVPTVFDLSSGGASRILPQRSVRYIRRQRRCSS
jgi:lysine 2,3-aminomutase